MEGRKHGFRVKSGMTMGDGMARVGNSERQAPNSEHVPNLKFSNFRNAGFMGELLNIVTAQGKSTAAPNIVPGTQDPVEVSRAVRRRIIEVAHRSRCPHVGCALSCVDILVALYFDVLRLEPWAQRDVCILSKGHAALALLCVLVERGLMEEGMLEGYFADGGTLPAHLDRFTAEGVEVSTGALGHGLSIGLGLALGHRRAGRDRRVFVVMGDGESQEGSVWEAALFAGRYGLDNLTAVVDFNNLQGYGRPTEICAFEPVAAKWKAFGWSAVEVDGHDMGALSAALQKPTGGRPRAVIARTVKGKGVSFMEDRLEWHYYIVTDEHRRRALEELG